MQIFESEFYFFYGKAGKTGISGPLCKSGGEEKVSIFADGTRAAAINANRHSMPQQQTLTTVAKMPPNGTITKYEL